LTLISYSLYPTVFR